MFDKQRRSNFTIEQGDGIADLLINSDVDNVNRMGFTTYLTAGYTFLWSKGSGFHTGLGVRYVRSGFASGSVESQTMGYLTAYNNEAEVTRRTHYTTSVVSVEETYKAFFLELPLQLTFQQSNFWVDYGFKLLLPLSVKASYNYGETSIGVGYRIDGFGTTIGVPLEIDRLSSQQGDYTVGSLVGGGVCYPAYVLFALSGGYRLAIDNNQSLRFGFYFDIALNRTHVGNDQNLVNFGNDITFNNVLQSNLVNSLRYVDCGISITYNFTFGKRIAYRRNMISPYRVSRWHKRRKAQIRW